MRTFRIERVLSAEHAARNPSIQRKVRSGNGLPSADVVLAHKPKKPPTTSAGDAQCSICETSAGVVGPLTTASEDEIAMLRWLKLIDDDVVRCCAGCRARVIEKERAGWVLFKQGRDGSPAPDQS